jgi:hypothetical protein
MKGVLASPGVNLAKLAVSALPAGAWGAGVVVLLILAGNPAQDEGTAARSIAVLAVLPIYAIAAAVLWPLLYGALRYFARHPLRLPWFSVRYAMAFLSAHGLIVLGSFWATLSHHRRALHPATVDRLEASGAVLTAAWLIAITVSVLPRLRRIGWLQWGCAALAGAALVIALPASWRPPPAGAGPAPGRPVAAAIPARAAAPAQRVILLDFDGADLETILTLQAQGRLPAFARLIQEGSHGRLRSLQPCVAPVVRATLLTGKLPYRHGVRGAAVRRLLRGEPWIAVVPIGLQFDRLLAPVLRTRPQEVADRRALAVHEIAAAAGGVGIAAGWETDLDAGGAEPPGGAPPGTTRPGGGSAWLAEFTDPEGLDPGDPPTAGLIAGLEEAVRADAAVDRVLAMEVAGRAPGVVLLSYPGFDRIAHLFLRHHRPRDFGGVPESAIERWGGVLQEAYRRADDRVARVLSEAPPGTVLLVTATHGIEPVPLRRRLLRGAADSALPSGTHAGAPDGFLFARGPGIEAGRRFGKGGLPDVAPTVLYALGLPAARDLDGAILAGVFTPAYTFEHPVTVIGTYEPSGTETGPAGAGVPEN